MQPEITRRSFQGLRAPISRAVAGEGTSELGLGLEVEIRVRCCSVSVVHIVIHCGDGQGNLRTAG